MPDKAEKQLQPVPPSAGHDPEDEEDDPREVRMSFTEHLGELRVRIIRAGMAVIIATAVCYIFSNQIFALIARPLTPAGFVQELVGHPDEAPLATDPTEPPPPAPAEPEREAVEWTVLNPIEALIVQIKLAIYGGFLLSLPFILWQACAFVFPGLRPSERRIVQIIIFGCSLLGTVGVLIAYFLVFPLVLPYLMQWVPAGVTIQLRMNETISILLMGLVGFAIAFQFPMAVLILVYLDLLTPATLKQYRKLAVIGIAGLSAVLTPPDPVSMTIMMIPLLLLYEISILLSYVVVRRRRRTT